jgi:hypothetical protein
MDNHPIPQDVTGFQFKLVGSMTVKQFVYVASGVLISVVIYYLPLNMFIKYPLIFVLVLLGLAIAFLPLEGRPMDLMAGNFLKALLKPNQFFYKKSGGKLPFSDLDLKALPTVSKNAPAVSEQKHIPTHNEEREARLKTLLSTIDEPKTSMDQQENAFLSTLFTTNKPTSSLPSTHTAPLPLRIQSQPTVTPSLHQSQPHTQAPIIPAQNVPKQTISVTQPVHPQTNVPGSITVQAPVSSPYTHVPPATQTKVSQTKTQLPDFPNLIMGTVKDSRGNILSGILVEVKNNDGESVRAFKTNALGQFASATQLPNGTYTIGFEDPKGLHTFSAVQVNITGTILPLLEVTSIDAREELRKSLFG